MKLPVPITNLSDCDESVVVGDGDGIFSIFFLTITTKFSKEDIILAKYLLELNFF